MGSQRVTWLSDWTDWMYVSMLFFQFVPPSSPSVHKSVLYIWVSNESGSCSVMSNSLWPHGLYSSWNSPGQNTGVGSLSLLQGSFPTQGSNPGLLHWGWILYQLSHKGSSRILEWVAYPLSSGSSWPRNWTGVSCIADGFFTNWAMREAHCYPANRFISTIFVASIYICINIW